MLRHASRRLLSTLLLLAVVSLATFCLVFSNGPGIARAILGEDATPETVAAKATELGLDQPVLVQYGHWVGDLLGGSLGASFYTREPVTGMLSTRIPVTLALTVVCMVGTALISVAVGTLAAVTGGWLDRLLQLSGVLGGAVPNFIVAVWLVSVFAISLRWFPATGYVSPDRSASGWVLSLVLPVTAILAGSVASAAQQFRGAVVDVLAQDFVRTLRARGLPEHRIVVRHVLRSAAGPGLTILGLQTIGLLGGVVIIEQVFALPGVGNLALSTTLTGDIPVVMGCVVFTVVVVVVVNLAADLLATWLNPRVRLA